LIKAPLWQKKYSKEEEQISKRREKVGEKRKRWVWGEKERQLAGRLESADAERFLYCCYLILPSSH